MDTESAPTRVTERERQHMRNIGRWKQESHDEALRRHLALSGTERLAAALALMARGPYFKPRFSLDVDDPAAFYAEAKRLGLYKG
ncbi:MAG: hypothetical protein ACR2NO_02310 [Chloroflexota bacterium]